MQEIPGPPSTQADSGGKTIGRYRCEECLGQSAGFEIWRARVQGLAGFDRVFALHCLAPGLLARRPKAAESLLGTARQVAKLADERFVTIEDTGLAPGSAFVATEFVHGVSLDVLFERLTGRSLARPEAAAWGALLCHLGFEIASALGTAHAAARPVVHGTLAPASVRVTPQGAIKIVDYGFRAAILPPAQLPVTATRARYRAPEVRAGGEPTAASDLYALGALLHELATGTVPGQSNPRQPRSGNALPDGIQAPVVALLASDPGLRPTASQVAAQFEEALSGRGPDARAALAALVRQSEKTSPHSGATPLPPSAQSHSGIFAADEASDFIEEPTKLLEVAADGNPASLAKILEEMREVEGQEAESAMRRQFSSPTPVVGVPLFDGGTATAVADLRDILSSLPPDPETEASGELDSFANRANEQRPGPISTQPESAPGESLPEMRTAEVAAPFEESPSARIPGMQDAEAVPQTVRFADFSSGNSLPQAELTPSGWHPTVDRSGGTDIEETPGAAGLGQPRLGRSRTLAMSVAAAGAALAAALIFILRTDDGARTGASTPPNIEAPRSTAQGASVPAAIDEPADDQSESAAGKSKGDEARAEGAEPETARPEGKAAGAPAEDAEAMPTGTKALADSARAERTKKEPAPSTDGEKSNSARRLARAALAKAEGRRRPRGGSQSDPAANTPQVAETVKSTEAAETQETQETQEAQETGSTNGEAAVAEEPLPAGQIALDSKPSGAVVWMAGKRRGKTPLRLEAPEEATMVRLVRPGHVSATVMLDKDTSSTLEVPLAPAQTPEEGEAVLSVACPSRNRLLLMVDGLETGRFCPASRLRLPAGTHQIGVLDPSTGQVHTKEITLEAGRNVLDLAP